MNAFCLGPLLAVQDRFSDWGSTDVSGFRLRELPLSAVRQGLPSSQELVVEAIERQPVSGKRLSGAQLRLSPKGFKLPL